METSSRLCSQPPPTLRHWLKIKSSQWLKTPRKWLQLASIWQDLAVYGDENTRSGPIASNLDDLWNLAADTTEFTQRQTKTKDAAYWAKAVQSQIDPLRQPLNHAHRIVLVIGTAILALAITIPQIAIAYCLQEWNAVARATGDHARTVVMFIALARYPSINLPLIWLFLQNRLIGSLPSIIFYAVPAFYKPLRQLYGTPAYTYAVIPVLIKWLALISFYGHLRIAWTRFRTRKEPPLTGQHLAEAKALLERWQRLILCLETELDALKTSDLMGQSISLLKKYIENTCSALEHAIGTSPNPAPIEPEQTHYPRPEKFAILVAALACMLADITTNLDKPFFMTEKVAINAWITARLFWCAWSLYQSKTDILKLCCDLVSGPTLSLALVTPAKIVGLFKTNKYLLPLTIVHTTIVFIFARHTAILYRAIAKLVSYASHLPRLSRAIGKFAMSLVRSFATTIHLSPKLVSTQHQHDHGTFSAETTEELITINKDFSTSKASSILIIQTNV